MEEGDVCHGDDGDNDVTGSPADCGCEITEVRNVHDDVDDNDVTENPG